MKHKLQTHFFMTYFLTALIVVLLFSILFYRYTSDILIERETKSLQELNHSFLSQTDAEIRELDSVSINISYSNLVKEQLSECVGISAASDEFRNLSMLFMTINGTNLNADQINLYDYNGSTPEQIAATLRDYLVKNYHMDINLNAIARNMHYSSGYLTKIFQQQYHVPPLKFITQLRLSQAKHYLAHNPEMSVKQISEMIGYQNQGYFSRLFKKNTGVSPMDWRNMP